ncbi:macrolide transporter subunit MacA [Planctomycetes bacterium K23_9]|uniref:Macrolide transporter subunit MacA n=2 Tax=Stieleria marina TaxID=1930275 RepID=A0A517NTZ3_9BACT|nr:macrolide transporter subunit MacA [Planctomycetes bacterium K23_9]
MKIAAFFVVVATLAVTAVSLLPGNDAASTANHGATHTVTRGELVVALTEQGTLESSNNTEVKCRVRGDSTITFVIESGTQVQPGDVLVRLETLAIEEEISERTKFYHLAEAQVARSAADVARAKLAISEYEQGRFVSELATLQKNLAIAESSLLNAKNRLEHSEMLSRSEYANELELEEKEFAVSQAKLTVGLTKTQIDVLQNFTKKEELVRLQGDLKAAKATHEANVERSLADKNRLQRAKEELGYCTIVAERAGLVIYPTGEAWKNAPEIEEGATVRKDQTLLLMPDLTQMQVKVGIHESVVDRMRTGMEANVILNRALINAEVTYVAAVAKPASWWTGNIVKYDATVSLPSAIGMRPGMSAEVEIVIARHDDVVTIPAAACIETQAGFACWVQGESGVERRSLKVGDSNDMFLVVHDGIQEGDVAILDPLANVKEAQVEAANSLKDYRSIL